MTYNQSTPELAYIRSPHHLLPASITTHKSSYSLRIQINSIIPRAHITPNLEPFVTYLHIHNTNPRHPNPKQLTHTQAQLITYTFPQIYSINTINSPKVHTNCTKSPPSSPTHVDPRPKTKKRVNWNSSNPILFVNQRDFPEFPQNIKPHLVTLFSVYLRVLPFSEIPPKPKSPQIIQKLFQPRSN
jgi:hypothetical protein